MMISLKMILKGEFIINCNIHSSPVPWVSNIHDYDSPALHCAVPGEEATKERKYRGLYEPFKYS